MRDLAHRRPFAVFAVLAYLLSWSLWGGAIAAGGPGAGALPAALYILGGFGPFAAGALTVALRRGGVLGWLLGLLRWRAAPKFWAFALIWPPVYALLSTLAFGTFGGSVDVSLLGTQAAGYLPAFAYVAVAGGGNEEPGWRGVGLPALQSRMSPLAATLVLGLVWALWHLPLAALGLHAGSPGAAAAVAAMTLVGIVLHAAWYTWLFNRTGSVLLCIVLHGSYNAALGTLILVPMAEQETGYLGLLACTTGVLAVSVAALLAATGGRLGAGPGGGRGQMPGAAAQP